MDSPYARPCLCRLRPSEALAPARATATCRLAGGADRPAASEARAKGAGPAAAPPAKPAASNTALSGLDIQIARGTKDLIEPILPDITVVIPVAEKDLGGIPACVSGILEHSCNPVRDIYVIGAASLRSQLSMALPMTWVDEESVYPSLVEVRKALAQDGYQHHNAGWYFQQVMKLCAFRILRLSGQHLVVLDADVLLVRDASFVDKQGRSLVPFGYPLSLRLNTRVHTVPSIHSALTSASHLVPGWRIVDPFSGMHHHMPVSRTIADDLLNRVEASSGLEFWRAFIASVERQKWHGISEYVIYRHFAIANHPQLVHCRHLNSIDIIEPLGGPYRLENVAKSRYPSDTDLLSCHQFSDYRLTLSTMDYMPQRLRASLLHTNSPLALRLDQGLLRIHELPRAPDSRTLDLLDGKQS